MAQDLSREVDRTLELERKLVVLIRGDADELGFKLERHQVTTDELKETRVVVVRLTRSLSGQLALKLTKEREEHPDNIPDPQDDDPEKQRRTRKPRSK